MALTLKTMSNRLISTDNDKATILVRLMVGVVFLSEGYQKIRFAESLGVGRFRKIGIPAPEFFAPIVGTVELICGGFILFGMLTRLAAIPLIIIMLMAIATTKAPILVNDGFWKMLHESRTDWAMLLGSLFLLIKGGGKWSIDRKQIQSKY
jgi:putative oxidoreductase